MSTITVPGAASAGGRGVAVSAGAVGEVHLIAGLTGLAFLGRLAFRLTSGEADFIANSYSFYLDIATSALRGSGLCLNEGLGCAIRLPLYPLFLAPWIASGWLYPGLVIAQSALGAALVWFAWRIGRDLFDARAGLVAAALTAVSPYAVIHDTGIQDTVLVNFLMGLAMYLLWQTRKQGAPLLSVAAGVTMGLVMLTTARLTLAVPAVLAWALVGAGPTWGIRLRSAILIGLPILLLAGVWIARNTRVVGTPVFTTEAGESLWIANNEWTMTHFPDESIDLSVGESYERMTGAQRAAFDSVSSDEVVRDRLVHGWATAYIAAHPGLTIRNGLLKVWVTLSARLSPARGRVLQWGYFALFAPLHVLSAIALWRARHAWRVHALTGALLLSFAATTAVYWAHTSHKSYLDMLLFVYAAGAFARGSMESVS